MSNLTAQVETITPAKAKALLDKNKTNRPISEKNLAFLMSEMKRDNFHLTGESIKVAKSGNLLDGQHRLLSIVQTGIPVKMLVARGLEEDAFKYIDTGKMRTAADVLGIEGHANPTRLASMVKFIIHFNKGRYGTVATSSGAKESVTNADVSDFVSKHKKSLLESIDFGFCKENKLVPPNILSSLHYIFKKVDAEKADDFCWKVAIGDGLTKGSPIYMLRQALLNDIRSTRKMKRTTRLAIICKAWNLFRAGKSVTVLKWESVKEPFPKPDAKL